VVGVLKSIPVVSSRTIDGKPNFRSNRERQRRVCPTRFPRRGHRARTPHSLPIRIHPVARSGTDVPILGAARAGVTATQQCATTAETVGHAKR
jgi:hypothetical protein